MNRILHEDDFISMPNITNAVQHNFATVAQQVEQLIRNQQVGGSNPSSGLLLKIVGFLTG